jgi:predicted Zn-dependent peptidase
VSDLSVLDVRPGPGAPRRYDFPDFRRSRLDNDLEVILAHVPGRPLLQAQLIVRGEAGGGATPEPGAVAGATLLSARAMAEGTQRRDAVAFVEAAERLGASLGATAGWDDLSVHLDVPRTHLRPALGLMAELALEPIFPEREVERLREERLNDLKQAMADPRRRAERMFCSTIYAAAAAYGRPLGGSEETVAQLDRAALVERHAAQMRPEACTLIVCGDLEDLEVEAIVAEAFGGWLASGAGTITTASAKRPARKSSAPPAPDAGSGSRRVVLVDRPGAPQSEIRIGHVGSRRRIEDYHALMVLNTLFGGLFDSRLNRLLREDRGYTYGVRSEFDLRRSAGPFGVRLAVESAVTAPAVADVVGQLERIRDAVPEPAELDAARDYLVGVFPLRFESSAQVAAALAGLVISGLPDDELDRYRPTVAAVTADAALEAARRHIRPDEASIVIVGDVARFEAELRAAGHGEAEVIGEDDAGEVAAA